MGVIGFGTGKMYYNEDTTTGESIDNNEDRLLILDGTARLDYIDQAPEPEKKTRLETLLNYIKRKL
jgi:hypothetical protein